MGYVAADRVSGKGPSTNGQSGSKIRSYAPATGELIGCFGLTEPDHGSDPGSMVTRAEKVAGGYQLNADLMPEFRVVGVRNRRQVESVDFHRPAGQLDGFPIPGQVIGPLAVNFDG